MPLSTAERTAAAATSMNVCAPGSAQRNVTSVVDRNVPSPGLPCPVGQIQGDVVPGHLEQAGPLGGLDLGQVTNSGHVTLL